MTIKLDIWDEKRAKKELHQRLKAAMAAREPFEKMWRKVSETLYTTEARFGVDGVITFSSKAELMQANEDYPQEGIQVNYCIKNLRLNHSQLCANPPSVVPRPNSPDPADRRKADAADRVIRHSMRQYTLSDTKDWAVLYCLAFGTGYVMEYWDPNKGDITDFDEKTGEITMEGDICIEPVHPCYIYLDPDARTVEQLRFFFRRYDMPLESAIAQWPDKKYQEIFQKATIEDGQSTAGERIRLYRYFEKGLPCNGFQGREAWCLEDGTLLGKVEKSSHSFAEKPGSKFKRAYLPLHIFTDIDVPDQVMGLPTVAYSAGIQESINCMDNAMLDALRANGLPRLILTEGTEISDESITNSPYDIVKVTGNQPPSYQPPMPPPNALSQFRMQMQQGLNDTDNVNEAMMGITKDRQANSALQYAAQQGNMANQRRFNKFTYFVEGIYRDLLRIVAEKWNTARVIRVLGKEKAYESKDIAGADVDGGYDIVVEFGTSFSLNPQARREEIIPLIPLFEKAGVEAKTILSMMRLNEVETMMDMIQLASDRQREIFEEMDRTQEYIEPEELQDHKAMLAWAYSYLMTSEFKYLQTSTKNLIRKHVKEREDFAKKGAAALAQQSAPLEGGMPNAEQAIPTGLPPGAGTV